MEKVYFNFIKGARRGPDASGLKSLLPTLFLLALNALLAAAVITAPAGGTVEGRPSGEGFPSARPALDTAAFDAPAMADIKAAFKNLDSAYLKRLSHDVYELERLSAVSPSRVLKLLESAYNSSIVLKSVSLQDSGSSAISASVSGRALSNANFITFSDHISRSAGVRGFSFDSKKTGTDASGQNLSAGIDFTLTFEMEHD